MNEKERNRENDRNRQIKESKREKERESGTKREHERQRERQRERERTRERGREREGERERESKWARESEQASERERERAKERERAIRERGRDTHTHISTLTGLSSNQPRLSARRCRQCVPSSFRLHPSYYIAVFCIVSQCVAVHAVISSFASVLVCRSVSQCIAMCCSACRHRFVCIRPSVL